MQSRFELACGVPAEALDEVCSTNAEAMRRAGSGEAGPLWVLARRQTRGRGRSGRSWANAEGNFFASLLLTLDGPPGRAAKLSLVAGIAVIDAVRAVAGRDLAGLRLKWPNDVLLGDAKLAGILIESQPSSGSDGRLTVVVGIGINIAAAPDGLGRAVTCLALHGAAVTPIIMLEELGSQMAHWLTRWHADPPGGTRILEAWQARAMARGEPISVHTTEGPAAGTFAGLDVNGCLLLDTPAGRRRFTHGDVTLRSLAPAGSNSHD